MLFQAQAGPGTASPPPWEPQSGWSQLSAPHQHHRRWLSSALSVLVGKPGPLLLSGRMGTASHPVPTPPQHLVWPGTYRGDW